MKLVSIIGTRPQFIKAAMLSKAVKKYPNIKEVIVYTGQHYDKNMAAIFFNELDITSPHYNLNIGSLSHGAMTGRMIESLETVLIKEKPDVAVLFGDCDTTLAGAVAARKLNIKLAHIEAGLRSYDMKMPEEINRVITDRISDFLFCPAENAIKNLYREGFKNMPCKIVNTGDIMLDAAMHYISSALNISSSILKNISSSSFALCTIHRKENIADPDKLKNILQALIEINKKTPVVFPVHPRTLQSIQKLNIPLPFELYSPVGYLEMLHLINKAEIILTDSGGMQKEAFFLKKPCVTLRENTEWTELIKNGYNVLAGTECQKIISSFEMMRQKKLSFTHSFYGNGNAANLIVSFISENI